MLQDIALREWAVAVDALESGRQIIVLRKGGIAEETKEFRLESPRFYLFPSYEHQRPELVKPEARGGVGASIAEAESHPGEVRIGSYAEVAEDIEVTDSETLARLSGLHIWTDEYAEERLKWKKTKPLHVLLLRMYKLEEPAVVAMKSSYGGCKSWLALEDEVPVPKGMAVLGDEEFAERVAAVKRAIAGK
ncbi:DUF1802 family protein [Cohnella fermenti]|uniref:DUF1802 family protein n=1 Tax=Cohnella fermenti TaxID=2565925 RepID=A0A4S4CCM0_9BACL|nr:DUF1802 family protein [Cohnella fermenti]THF83702.1 DUF1802 family protein [Cohnella fermenti]